MKMSTTQYSYEKLNESINVCVSAEHRFGTDAFLLADFAAPRHKDIVCDLGTGCGIIPLVLCKRFEPSKIYGIDIQPEAIEQVKLSLAASSVATDVVPILCDLKGLTLEMLQTDQLDIVTCNPPYKADCSGIQNVGVAERIARHEVMCTIDDVCVTASRLLRFGGKLCVCQRPERLADVITAMRNNGIEPKRLRLVTKNALSAPWLVLVEGRKGGKPFLQIDAMFCMYDGDEYTEQLQAVYGNS